MKYEGSCHCGKIKFEVEGEIESVTECNCSICQRKGTLMWFVPRTALRLLTPEANLSTYLFNTHKIKHHFCASCGIQPYGEATAPNGSDMAAVNIRCLEGVDIKAYPVNMFDGRAV